MSIVHTIWNICILNTYISHFTNVRNVISQWIPDVFEILSNIYIKISLYCAYHCAFAVVGSESTNTASLGGHHWETLSWTHGKRWALGPHTGYDCVSRKIWPEEGAQVPNPLINSFISKICLTSVWYSVSNEKMHIIAVAYSSVECPCSVPKIKAKID